MMGRKMKLIENTEVTNWTNRRVHNCPICFSQGPITLFRRVYEDFYRDFSYYDAEFICPKCGLAVKTTDRYAMSGNQAVEELIDQMDTINQRVSQNNETI